MVQIDSRIRVTESKLVGMKNGVEIYYIEGFYSQDESDPIALPVEGISTGSILEEVETGNIKQFSERSSSWVSQFSIQTNEEDVSNVLSKLSKQLVNLEKNDAVQGDIR